MTLPSQAPRPGHWTLDARRSGHGRHVRCPRRMGTTGLEGSNQAPWISFSASWGKPAFLGDGGLETGRAGLDWILELASLVANEFT